MKSISILTYNVLNGTLSKYIIITKVFFVINLHLLYVIYNILTINNNVDYAYDAYLCVPNHPFTNLPYDSRYVLS